MTTYAALARRALDIPQSRIDLASDESMACDRATRASYDLCVLLLPLAGIDSAMMCRRLRAVDARVPIIVLDAYNAAGEAAVVATLDAGADAYLVEPIDDGELRARFAALLRRYRSAWHLTSRDIARPLTDAHAHVTDARDECPTATATRIDIGPVRWTGRTVAIVSAAGTLGSRVVRMCRRSAQSASAAGVRTPADLIVTMPPQDVRQGWADGR